MSKFPKKANHITELPICWIKKEEQFRLHTQSKGNNLPVIEITEENRDILKKFGAAYRKVRLAKGYEYEYWNESFYETEELTLPTYTFVCNEYHYIGQNTFSNPTRETIDEAQKIEEKIKNYFLEQQEQPQAYEGEIEDILKQILDNKPSKYIVTYDFDEDEEYETADDHFFVFVIKTLKGELTGHVLIFNRNMFSYKVKIELPKKYAKYICGKEACNLKRFCKKMGIKKIEVKCI